MTFPPTDLQVIAENQEQFDYILNHFRQHRPDVYIPEHFPTTTDFFLHTYKPYIVVRNYTQRTLNGHQLTLKIGSELPERLLPFDQFLEQVKQHQPLTNEQILSNFLKHHRKLASFKRQLGVLTTDKPIPLAITYLVYWPDTKEGLDFWVQVNKKWRKLVENFNLTGTVDLTKLR